MRALDAGSSVLNAVPGSPFAVTLEVFLQDERVILRKCLSVHIAHLGTEMRCRAVYGALPATTPMLVTGIFFRCARKALLTRISVF